MKILSTVLLVLLGGIAFLDAPGRAAEKNGVERLEKSVEVLREITAIPEKGIPPVLLKEAEAIGVIPGVYKVGFVLGGRYGRGVMAVRDQQGNWQNPFFITLKGGSVGWQIGAQSTDLILVFKDRGRAEAIKEGTFTLGADAAVAAGPVGRKAEAATDIELQAEIYSYSRSRGLFAGVSLEGAALQIDEKTTRELYGRPSSELEQVRQVPPAVRGFKQALREYLSP